ncbi:MAG: hypothetical protein ACC608_01730 [Anaerofustis sp.]
MDLILSVSLYFLAGWLIAVIITYGYKFNLKRKENRLCNIGSLQYEKDLVNFSAESLLKGVFIEGSSKLIPNAVYLIAANEQCVTIYDLNDVSRKFMLSYEQISDIYYKVQPIQKKVMVLGVISSSIGSALEHCIIQYHGIDGAQNLVFQFGPIDLVTYYDVVAIKRNDIRSYISARITKDENKAVQL